MVVELGVLASDFFVLFLAPVNLLASPSVEGCKRITEGRKEKKIPFHSKLYFGVQ